MKAEIGKYNDDFPLSLFSKRNVNFIKGVAVLLMYVHHLFGFPERISEHNVFIPISNSIAFEYQIAVFGKICVSIFLFLSGIGFSIIGLKSCNYYFNKVFRFYKSYFIVFVVFIPFGFISFGSINGNELDYCTLITNLFLLESSYNGEWWFASVYLICVGMTPIYLRCRPILTILFSFLFLVVYFIAQMLSIEINILLKNFLLWQVAYISGLFFFYIVDFFRLNKLLVLFQENKYIFSFIVFLLAVVSFIYLKVYALILFTPCVCVVISMLINKSNCRICYGFEWLGSKTLYMWLTHSFFCYYYFQDVVFLPKYSILIFINLFILTVPVSLLLEKLYDFLSNRSFSKIKGA